MLHVTEKKEMSGDPQNVACEMALHVLPILYLVMSETKFPLCYYNRNFIYTIYELLPEMGLGVSDNTEGGSYY